MQHMPGIGEGLLVMVMGLVWLGALAGYVIFLIAMWRAMRAHESIAATVRELADHLRSKP